MQDMSEFLDAVYDCEPWAVAIAVLVGLFTLVALFVAECRWIPERDRVDRELAELDATHHMRSTNVGHSNDVKVPANRFVNTDRRLNEMSSRWERLHDG